MNKNGTKGKVLKLSLLLMGTVMFSACSENLLITNYNDCKSRLENSRSQVRETGHFSYSPSGYSQCARDLVPPGSHYPTVN